MAPPRPVLDLFTIWVNVIIILVTVLLEIPFRPWVRMMRRFPPTRFTYRMVKLINNAQGRVYCRQDMLEATFDLVTWLTKWWDERKPGVAYNANVTYVPCLKVSAVLAI